MQFCIGRLDVFKCKEDKSAFNAQALQVKIYVKL